MDTLVSALPVLGGNRSDHPQHNSPALLQDQDWGKRNQKGKKDHVPKGLENLLSHTGGEGQKIID